MGAPVSLVFVDDDRVCAQLAEVAFSRDTEIALCGVACSAAEATTMILACRPRVVVTDWMLGDGEGTALIASLSPELPDTRWILTSGFACVALMRKADEVGAAGAIDKLRFADGALRKAILTVAAGGEYFCPASTSLLREALNPRTRLGLSKRQRQILGLIAEHHTRAEIAQRLQISRAAVSKHLGAIGEKLAFDGAPAISVLVPAARAAGLLPPAPASGALRAQDAI